MFNLAKALVIALPIALTLSADVASSFNDTRDAEKKLDATIKQFIEMQKIEHKLSGNNIINQKELNHYLERLKQTETLKEK